MGAELEVANPNPVAGKLVEGALDTTVVVAGAKEDDDNEPKLKDGKVDAAAVVEAGLTEPNAGKVELGVDVEDPKPNPKAGAVVTAGVDKLNV